MGTKNLVDIVTILNNPVSRAKLTNFIDEALICKRSIDDKNQDIKSIREAAIEKIGIEPKMFNQLLGLYHKGNFGEKQEEINQLESAIAMLTGEYFGSAPDAHAQFNDDDDAATDGDADE